MNQSQPLQDEEPRAQQLYPPPPPYYTLALSGELKPPPPPTGEYEQFGELYSTQDGIAPLRVRQLFETDSDGEIDFKSQLLVLHRELMAAFLELLAVLVNSPSEYARQVENVGLVLRNMLYLANQLRPQQAREELLKTLREQCKARKEAIKRLQAAAEAADNATKSAIETLREGDS